MFLQQFTPSSTYACGRLAQQSWAHGIPHPYFLSIPHQLTSHHSRFEGADHWVMPCAHPQEREKYTRALFSWRSNWFFLPQSSQDNCVTSPNSWGKVEACPWGGNNRGWESKQDSGHRDGDNSSHSLRDGQEDTGSCVPQPQDGRWPCLAHSLPGSQALQGPVLDQVPTLRSTAAQQRLMHR